MLSVLDALKRSKFRLSFRLDRSGYSVYRKGGIGKNKISRNRFYNKASGRRDS